MQYKVLQVVLKENKKWWFWLAIIAILLVSVCSVFVIQQAYLNGYSLEKNLEENITEDGQNLSPIYARNHPVLYDDGDTVEAFASIYTGAITERYQFEKGKTEIHFHSYGPITAPKDKILRDIEIYPKETLTIQSALSLAKDYLPMDVMRNRYEQAWSYKYCEDKSGERLYAQLYVPTDETRAWIENNQLPYNYALIVLYVQDNATVDTILLRSTNTVPNTGQNCGTEMWKYDIFHPVE